MAIAQHKRWDKSRALEPGELRLVTERAYLLRMSGAETPSPDLGFDQILLPMGIEEPATLVLAERSKSEVEHESLKHKTLQYFFNRLVAIIDEPALEPALQPLDLER